MNIKDILHTTAHRPWPLPEGTYTWHQEWNQLIFLHFRIDAAIIKPLIPQGLQADIFDGSAWVSVVPFSMQRIRPRLLPAWGPVSDFYEVNLRTYVTDGKKGGVYFFSLEASRFLPVLLAGGISGMPYEQAAIQRSFGQQDGYKIKNRNKQTFASISYKPGLPIVQKTEQELWLTERYAVYLDKKGRLYRYNVHHLPWPLAALDIQDISLEYRVGRQLITEKDIVSAQYSPGVQVLAWNREQL